MFVSSFLLKIRRCGRPSNSTLCLRADSSPPEKTSYHCSSSENPPDAPLDRKGLFAPYFEQKNLEESRAKRSA